MEFRYTDEQLRLAARLYYIDGMGQTEVARFVNVSQSKVSRLLAQARERGIVRISVAEYEPRHSALENQLRQGLGLDFVAAIKTTAGASSEDARRAVGHFGAPALEPLIPDQSTVAIAGGRTMRELMQHLPEAKKAGLTVVQSMGSIDSTVGPFDALELGRAMARRWDGYFLTLNTPAFVPDKATRDAFLGLEQIKSVWKRLGEVNVALVGIGTLENSIFVERGVLSAADLHTLKRQGAVGEICGRFFDREGRECDSPWRDRVLSIGLEQLRKIPQVVGIVAGADRSEALAAAIRGRLIKSLLTDEAAAAALAQQVSLPTPNGHQATS